MINSGCRLHKGMEMDLAHVTVEAYAGYKGEETPRAFTLEGARLSVSEIVAQWYTDTHSYFRICTSDRHRYVLRYDLENLVWELVMCETTNNEAQEPT